MSTPEHGDTPRETTPADDSMKKHGDPLLATSEGEPTEGSRHGLTPDQERPAT